MILSIVAAGLLVVAAVYLAPSQGARAVQVVTDEQIASVKSRCTEIKASLNRLEASDKLLRHNIGSMFLVVTDRLMTPLNQRIVSSQLDGSKLLEVTARYTEAYKGREGGDFYRAYVEYENSLIAAIAVDCHKQPTIFIDALDTARQNRLKLHTATERLVELARDYKVAFDAFKKQQAKQESKVK